MDPLQNLDFKELTGKIFKINDLLPRWGRKLFILRSLLGRTRVQIRPFSRCDPTPGADIQVSGPPGETAR